MTRKDTIIAAVLVNAGLLIVLFASALKSNVSEQNVQVHSAHLPEVNDDFFVQKERGGGRDEVDQVLKHYAQPQPLALESVPVVAQAVPIGFADDLRAITMPEAAAPAPVKPASVKPIAKALATDGEYKEYKVKKGDVLEKIARHHQSTVDNIMKMNRLTSVNLRIGQILKIPVKSSISVQNTQLQPSSQIESSSMKYYTVKNGDNPWTIAMKNQMKVEDLLKLNQLDEETARKLKPGDKLRIR